MGVIRTKANPDFRFLPAFADFTRFIDAAPLSRSDLLPPEPARPSSLEGKNRKVGSASSGGNRIVTVEYGSDQFDRGVFHILCSFPSVVGLKALYICCSVK